MNKLQGSCISILKKVSIALAVFLLTTAHAEDPTTYVEVHNMASMDGQLVLSVFDSKKSWLKRPVMTAKLPLSEESSEESFVFELDLLPGEYAFHVFHDVDMNGRMKTNFLGIPKEPTAVSNDAKGKFGPPKYKDAAIEIDEDGLRLALRLTKI